MKYNIKQIFALIVVALLAIAIGWMLSKFFPDYAYWAGLLAGVVGYRLSVYQLKIIK